MMQDPKLVVEACDANKSVENEVQAANLITGQEEVEILEKTFELDSTEKLEGNGMREKIEEETKEEDIKEVHFNTCIFT